MLLHIEVGYPFYASDSGLDAVGIQIKVIQVIAKKLDGNACLGTRKHGIDTVTDRLTEFDIRSREGIELVTNLLHHLFLRAILKFVWRFDFTTVHPTRVFIQLGTTGLASYGLNLRNGEQKFFGTTTEFVGFFERYTRHRGNIDGQRTFVERWQERATQGEEAHQSTHKESTGSTQHNGLMIQCPKQGAFVMFLHPYGYECFLRESALLVAQEVATKHRSQGQGHNS